MALFLLTFLLIYGSSNYFFYRSALRALAPGQTGAGILAVVLLAMVLAPIFVRLLEQGGHEAAARIAAYLGYSWMGFLFLFLTTALATTVWRLLVHLVAAISHRGLGNLLPSDHHAFLSCCGVALLACIYGWFAANDIRTEHVSIPTSKLPPGSTPIRIAQISDVHFGLIVRQQRARRIITAIRAAAPDIIVSTGDLVDGHVTHFDGVSEQLQELKPPLGMYAVTGNHEYYVGLKQSLDFTRRAGFRVLQGESLPVGDYLTVVGVDDPTAARFNITSGQSEKQLLQQLPSKRFTLLLKHRPVSDKGSDGLYDLQLSGHVHKGQIFPFNFLTWLNFPVKAGLNHLNNGAALYVSRGTGTWGPPIRVLAPPEVTIFELIPTPSPLPGSK